jgi:hypothetical protein
MKTENPWWLVLMAICMGIGLILGSLLMDWAISVP